MKITSTLIQDVKLITPVSYKDNRGMFMESFRCDLLKSNGIDYEFVQDNIVESKKNILRGLHFQKINPQGKLIQALSGKIFDVAVDIREKSSTYGNWVGEFLSYENKKQLFIPPGCAHGYCVVSSNAKVMYKCTDYFMANDQYGIIWNDPNINIKWPINSPILSDKDKLLPQLKFILEDVNK